MAISLAAWSSASAGSRDCEAVGQRRAKLLLLQRLLLIRRNSFRLIRAFAAAAFVLLHVIFCVGPLCRLDRSFLPLDFVAEPVAITGEIERQGELLIFRADPATYRRVAK